MAVTTSTKTRYVSAVLSLQLLLLVRQRLPSTYSRNIPALLGQKLQAIDCDAGMAYLIVDGRQGLQAARIDRPHNHDMPAW